MNELLKLKIPRQMKWKVWNFKNIKHTNERNRIEILEPWEPVAHFHIDDRASLYWLGQDYLPRGADNQLIDEYDRNWMNRHHFYKSHCHQFLFVLLLHLKPMLTVPPLVDAKAGLSTKTKAAASSSSLHNHTPCSHPLKKIFVKKFISNFNLIWILSNKSCLNWACLILIEFYLINYHFCHCSLLSPSHYPTPPFFDSPIMRGPPIPPIRGGSPISLLLDGASHKLSLSDIVEKSSSWM